MPRLVPRVFLTALALSSGPFYACGDDEPSAAPPGTAGAGARDARDGGGRPVPIPRRDSGMNDPDSGDDDSGTAGTSGAAGSAGAGGTTAPMVGECENFDPAKFVGGDPTVDVIASSAQPMDFEITRAVATWEPDCTEPTIRVDLSDGSCPNGKGHQLTFWFAAEAIDSRAIFLGLNSVLPEPDNGGVKIRYTRPTRLSPTGVWGTCPLATATLNFVGEMPSTDQFSRLQISQFFLELTACDGANAPIIVEGSFNVKLQRGLREACPLD